MHRSSVSQACAIDSFTVDHCAESFLALTASSTTLRYHLSNDKLRCEAHQPQPAPLSASQLLLATARTLDLTSKRKVSSLFLRRFIQIICNFCPLVLVVDDIQWADRASLNLIQSWISNIDNAALMIVGCYRSNLLDANQALKETSLSLEACKRERGIRILNIEVHDLELAHIVDLLRAMFEEEDLHKLAEIVLERTGGNPFFIQQYLQSLLQHKLLSYDEKAMRWTWNTNDIVSKSPKTTTNMMKNNLQQVRAARQVLPIAACLGASFSTSILCKAIRALSIHSSHAHFFRDVFVDGPGGVSTHLTESDIWSMLKVCEREGFLESQDHKKPSADKGGIKAPASSSNAQGKKTKRQRKKADLYAFAHDKVQEASLALIPEDKLCELQYRVGQVLLSSLSADELDNKIFMVTSLLNIQADLFSSQENADRRMQIALLNHQAGRKAASCSAFDPVLEYFQKAIALLPPDTWKSHFQTTLDIYSSAAECAYVISDMATMQLYCVTR